jgi:osmotically-inducible protein OsmY
VAGLLGGCLKHRGTGAMLDDQNIELRVISAIGGADGIGRESHIKVEVYERMVLLAGETDTEDKKALAERLAADVDQVDRVVNEIEVREREGVAGKFGNSWLTTKVNTELMTENVLPGFDPHRIKVVSSAGTVFLMGNVTRDEGDAVTEVVRNVRGVDKVVKVFNYESAE